MITWWENKDSFEKMFFCLVIAAIFDVIAVVAQVIAAVA